MAVKFRWSVLNRLKETITKNKFFVKEKKKVPNMVVESILWAWVS